MEKLKQLHGAIAAATIAAFAVGPAAAQDFPLEWHWVRVTPSGTTKAWDVEQSAKADIVFKGDRFVARLFDDADPASGDQPDIILQGRSNGRDVTAIETLPGTDAGHRVLHGIIVRTRSTLKEPSNGWGEDRISLVAGSEFIGLSRMVRSAAPPGK